MTRRVLLSLSRVASCHVSGNVVRRSSCLSSVELDDDVPTSHVLRASAVSLVHALMPAGRPARNTVCGAVLAIRPFCHYVM